MSQVCSAMVVSRVLVCSCAGSGGSPSTSGSGWGGSATLLLRCCDMRFHHHPNAHTCLIPSSILSHPDPHPCTPFSHLSHTHFTLGAHLVTPVSHLQATSNAKRVPGSRLPKTLIQSCCKSAQALTAQAAAARATAGAATPYASPPRWTPPLAQYMQSSPCPGTPPRPTTTCNSGPQRLLVGKTTHQSRFRRAWWPLLCPLHGPSVLWCPWPALSQKPQALP
jgi:hypothetical protein